MCTYSNCAHRFVIFLHTVKKVDLNGLYTSILLTLFFLRGIIGKRTFRLLKLSWQPLNAFFEVNKRGAVHFFQADGRFLANFFDYTGGPFYNLL